MKIIKTIIFAAMFAAVCSAGAFAQEAAHAATGTAGTEAATAGAQAAPSGAARDAGAKAEAKSAEGDTLDDALDRMETSDKFTAGRQAPQIRGGGFAYLMKVLFSLLIVIVMIVVTVFVLKQIYSKSMRLDLKGHHVKIVDVVQLGVNKTVYLVSVGNRALLLGTGEKGLVYLDDVTEAVNLGDGEEEFAPDGTSGAQPVGLTFRKQLNEALGIKKRPGAQGGPTPLRSGLKERIGKLADDGGSEEKS